MCARSGASAKSSFAPMYSPSTIPPSSKSPPVMKKVAETLGIQSPLSRFGIIIPERRAPCEGVGLSAGKRAEHLLEASLQRRIDVGHCDGESEVGEAGDAVAAHAAGHDSREVRKVGRDVQRDAVERHPVANANADGGDLVLASAARHPDADAVRSALALHAEFRKRTDQPFFQIADERAHVRFAALEVEHEIDHALAGAVIGELSAATRLEHGKTGIEQIGLVRTRSRRIDGRMFYQPATP